MKSQIISQNKGFLTMEIMLAFSLLTLFTLSTFTLSSTMQKLKVWALQELDKLEDSTHRMDNIISNSFNDLSIAKVSPFGNDSELIYIDPFTITHSDYKSAWGRNSCDPRLHFDSQKTEYFNQGTNIGSGNVSTDLEVRNNIVYLSADSNISSRPDFFIIDAKDSSHPIILSSLNTGPGVSAIEIAGHYSFLALSSTVNQLQIVDMHDRTAPKVISQLKVSLPTPTTTAPFSTSIFYSEGFIYLGTVKWSGKEFFIIDVNDPYKPKIVGSFETNTQVNEIYLKGDTAYLATPNFSEMRILDINDKTNPILVDSFSPSGWQVQEGKSLEYFEGALGFGRVGGGFNVVTNHEAFIFATGTDISNYISKDIPGGVYSLLLRPPFVFFLTHSPSHEFQIWNSNLSSKVYDLSLNISALKMVCDRSSLFFATGDQKGISILKLHE